MLRVRLLAAALLAGLCGTAAPAQERVVVPSPVLTVDQDELFERSAFGRRVARELEADSTALAAENRRIEAELAEEERSLTERRPGMDAAEFRTLAAEFDARVVAIRREQDQKARELSRRPEEARVQFFRAAVPILTELVRERGAVAILDSRAVLLSADLIDITDEALRRIDAELGEDGAAAAPSPAPATSPDAGTPPGTPRETPPETPSEGQP